MDGEGISFVVEVMDLFSLRLTVVIVKVVAVVVGMFEVGGCGDGVRVVRARFGCCGVERKKSVSDSESEFDSTSSVDLVVVTRRRFRIFDEVVSDVVASSSAGEGVFITRRRERI